MNKKTTSLNKVHSEISSQDQFHPIQWLEQIGSFLRVENDLLPKSSALRGKKSVRKCVLDNEINVGYLN